jgi:hypothetical protein
MMVTPPCPVLTAPFHAASTAPARLEVRRAASPDITTLRNRLTAAKWRCDHATNHNRAYAGIAFEFPSPAIGARLLLATLGPIPPGTSLDRINPKGPYSIENLGYATPLLQVLNRRRKPSVSHWTKDHG